MEKLLLLSCCAPCSCGVIKELGQKTGLAVLFYNPNIMPREEYEKRKEENKKVCLRYGVPFYDLDYENAEWLAAVKGLEHEPERGERCSKCFYVRLKRAAAFAKKNGFKKFSSVLGVSRYKDLAQVNRAAAVAAAEEGVEYIDIVSDKQMWSALNKTLAKELGLYSQKYCGCKFSPSEKEVF